MSVVLTPIYTDHFTPNANPLNPTNWQSLVSQGQVQDLQAASGECEVVPAAVGQTYGEEIFIGATIPNDCYASFTVGEVVVGSLYEVGIALRSSADGLSNTCYLDLYDDGQAGTATIEIDVAYNGGQNEQQVAFAQGIIVRAGDVFTIAVIGQTAGMYHNGTLLDYGTNANIAASGYVAPFIFANNSVTDFGFSQLVIGSASGTFTSSAYSVPDCRVSKPNSATSRNVNGTLTYDVQTSSNHAVPGTDSRTAVPTASGTYPQNSRTPGTFGPGE